MTISHWLTRVLLTTVRFFVCDLCAPLLVDMLAAFAAVVVDVFAKRGPPLNFKTNKTEAMVALRGKGAVQAKQQLVFAEGACLELCIPGHPSCHLRIVASYKHMGGQVSPGGHMLAEIKARAGDTLAVFRGARAHVWRNARLTETTRGQPADSLLDTRLFFQCRDLG